jgi:WD40 repeat protein
MLSVLGRHDGWGEHVARSKNGRLIATGSDDHTARLWEVVPAEQPGQADWVRGIAWSPDGMEVTTASHDGTARIWDAALGTQLRVLRGHKDCVKGVAWSPDG